jgi:hypothetical protein
LPALASTKMTAEAYLLACARRRIVPLALTAVWVFSGCGAADDGEALPDIGPGRSSDVFPDTLATAVEFERSDVLTLFAGQSVPLAVQVTPAGAHTVRFALLGLTGNAFLDPSVVETGPDGVAQTELTALTAGSSFTVRAAAGRASDTIEVLTLEASVASLDVKANYDGNRPIDEWIASVHVDTACSTLTGVPFPDGRLESRGAETLHIEGIPAEVPVAVVVRAKQFAGGCRSLAPLRANSLSLVEVDVMDRPMQTENLSLRFELGVDATEAPNPALDELAFRAASSLAGGASDDLAALLDAMSTVAEDGAAFEAARAAQGWRAALVNGLAPELPGSGLRTLVQNWMRSGIDLLEAPAAFQGTLVTLAAGSASSPESTGSGAPSGEGAAQALGASSLTLETVIGLAPEQTGFEVENTATAVAETDDVLRLGATLDWLPSTFFSAAASRAALARDPERTSAADAMAEAFGCDDVASIIVAAGVNPGEAYAGCDESCVLEMCRGAMVQLWSRIAASNLPAVPWPISGAARAQIDDLARPMRIEGSWIGTLDVPNFGSTPIQGPFSGDAVSRE